jgi:hypothetical protein
MSSADGQDRSLNDALRNQRLDLAADRETFGHGSLQWQARGTKWCIPLLPRDPVAALAR